MRKVIAAINITLDGNCDHTAVDPDEEIHDHYTQLLKQAGIAIYGRITFHLMEYWRTLLDNPSGNAAMDEFATAMDQIPKLVFSKTLKSIDWKSADLATEDLEATVRKLKQESWKDIFACSPGIITQLANKNLIDEWQLCVHPIIAGPGKMLFADIQGRTKLELMNTKTFSSGAIVLYYSVL